jgi:hypothetical protein
MKDAGASFTVNYVLLEMTDASITMPKVTDMVMYKVQIAPYTSEQIQEMYIHLTPPFKLMVGQQH